LWLLVVVYFVVYDCQGCLVLFVVVVEEEEGNLQQCLSLLAEVDMRWYGSH
jgi:hypothetical protein